MARPRLRSELKCYLKPFRTARRVFSKRDAIRICCDVLQHGRATYREINTEIAACSQSRVEEEFQTEVEQAVQVSVDILADLRGNYLENDNLLLRVLALLGIVIAILQAVQLLARFFPLVRISSVAVSAALQQANALVVRVNVQRAANDALFRRVIERVRELTIRRAA